MSFVFWWIYYCNLHHRNTISTKVGPFYLSTLPWKGVLYQDLVLIYLKLLLYSCWKQLVGEMLYTQSINQYCPRGPITGVTAFVFNMEIKLQNMFLKWSAALLLFWLLWWLIQSLNDGCKKRTEWSVGGRPLFIPKKASQWRRKP